MNNELHIFGGGTFSYVRNHLALSAPAFGKTARQLFEIAVETCVDWETVLHLTKMADNDSSIVTNEQLMMEVLTVIRNPSAKAVIFNAAVCDFGGSILQDAIKLTNSGKLEERLRTADEDHPIMVLSAKEKLVSAIKPVRPDIRVISFKTTCGSSVGEMIDLGRRNLIKSNSDVVLVNDTKTYHNLVLRRDGLKEKVLDFGSYRISALQKIVEIATNSE